MATKGVLNEEKNLLNVGKKLLFLTCLPFPIPQFAGSHGRLVHISGAAADARG